MKNFSTRLAGMCLAVALAPTALVSAQSYMQPAASANRWTWIAGSSAKNQMPLYGTMGMAAASNTPGSRTETDLVTDNMGRTWLFGGMNASGARYSDLWVYTPSTGNWTWMAGPNTTDQNGSYGSMAMPAASNNPGARSGHSIGIDGSNNIYVFGGMGKGATGNAGLLNDLWEYQASSGYWMHLKGSTMANVGSAFGTMGTAGATNMPSGRKNQSMVVLGNGNIFMMGGYGKDGNATTGLLNDLWKYNTTSSNWTWMKGSMSAAQMGTYGTMGMAAMANTPGARETHAMAADNNGNLWLFGGSGMGSMAGMGNLNDMWMYNTSSNQWAWMSGANSTGQMATYGMKGVSDPANMISARMGATMEADNMGRMWVYGGFGMNAGSTVNYADMWRYNTNSGMWTWMAGNNSGNAFGTYGTKGMATLGTNPPSRGMQGMSIDNANSRIWVAGGATMGYPNAASPNAVYADLWRYDISANTATMPTVQVSNLMANNIHTTDVALSFTKGDGFKDLVLLSTTPITSATVPVQGELYNADPNYASTTSSRIGNAHVVYSAANTGVLVTGLMPGTMYYAAAYGYNRAANDGSYLTTSPALTSFVTPGTPPPAPGSNEPTMAATNLSVASVGRNTMKVTWTNGNGALRLLLRSTSPFTASDLPMDGFSYNKGNTIGNSIVMYRGTGTTVAFNGLTPNTMYYLAVVEVNGFTGTSNYLTSAYPTTTATTLNFRTEGLDENSIPMLAYPNPFSSNVNVMPTTTGTLVVSDLSGRTLETRTAVQGQATQIGENLTPGIYMVRNGNDVIRIVKGE